VIRDISWQRTSALLGMPHAASAMPQARSRSLRLAEEFMTRNRRLDESSTPRPDDAGFPGARRSLGRAEGPLG
jgi:hypothetical protein